MNTLMRLLLVVLISLALPLNGMAAAELSAEPCQMQTDLEMDGHAGHLATADDEPHAHQGNPLCDSGHQCKTGSLLPALVARAVFSGTPQLPGAAYPEFLPAGSGADVWRPPRH